MRSKVNKTVDKTPSLWYTNSVLKRAIKLQKVVHKMYKIVGENNGKETVMFIMLSYEKAFEICELLDWEWADRAGNTWEMRIAKQ